MGAIVNFMEVKVSDLWIAFGVGKHFKYIPVHELAGQLGPQQLIALLMFHAFTGCDIV